SVAVEHRGGTGTCTVGAAPALVRAQLQVGEQVRYVQRRIAEGGEVEVEQPHVGAVEQQLLVVQVPVQQRLRRPGRSELVLGGLQQAVQIGSPVVEQLVLGGQPYPAAGHLELGGRVVAGQR